MNDDRHAKAVMNGAESDIDDVCHCGLGPESHTYPGAAEHSYVSMGDPPEEEDDDTDVFEDEGDGPVG